MDNSRSAFVVSIWLATIFPMLFFLMFRHYDHFAPALGVKEVLVFLGAAHVPATLIFYRDPRFQQGLGDNRILFYVIPAILTIAGGLVFAFSSDLALGIFLCAFWCWQAYHYGKQNIGVYSFTSVATTGRPTDPKSKQLFILLAWVSIFGTLKVLGRSVMPADYFPFFETMHSIGMILYLGLVGYSVILFIRNRMPLFSVNGLMFFTLVAFFGPMYFTDTLEGAFLSYAIAHALQYLVFMAIIASGTEKDGRAPLMINSLYFVLIVAGVGAFFVLPNHLATSVFYGSSDAAAFAIDLAVGAVLGATMAHFLIDAHTWRLSNPTSRDYVRQRFAFLFSKPPSSRGA
ncbi:MAG: hypothetical protein KF735_03465 [Chelatococcus sp.]|uniref:hypothetical protein n=1 Tax=Chelatococcus sp. TaxID=1953771 RepID=UPI0025C490F1|nr:hypothetical protein [Chelatococcus sp.]MBX3536669.1 hypothetical protein [Chelatococcus sp.]